MTLVLQLNGLPVSIKFSYTRLFRPDNLRVPRVILNRSDLTLLHRVRKRILSAVRHNHSPDNLVSDFIADSHHNPLNRVIRDCQGASFQLHLNLL